VMKGAVESLNSGRSSVPEICEKYLCLQHELYQSSKRTQVVIALFN
jgi:hypothetical protein